MSLEGLTFVLIQLTNGIEYHNVFVLSNESLADSSLAQVRRDEHTILRKPLMRDAQCFLELSPYLNPANVFAVLYFYSVSWL